MTKTPIAVAEGDGIGPEIMGATLAVLNAAGAQIEINRVEIGEKMYLKGYETGVDPKSWDIIQNCKALLKAPISMPVGSGFKNFDLTIRRALGLYASVRPCVSYFPFLPTKHPEMDLVIIRENEEDHLMSVQP